VSQAVTDEELHGPELRQLALDMHATMLERKGAGLSAVQVGVAKRMFGVLQDDSLTQGPHSIFFVNPEIVSLSDERETKDEGCLSLPNIFVPLSRAKRVVLTALDLDGRKFTHEAEGITARALQHEMEHLDGKTIADHVGAAQRDLFRSKLRKAGR
jgi:peptide deformylase